MNVKLRVLAFVVSTIAVMFTSLSFGGYDANELKREIARKEKRYKEMREARVKMAEYAFDDSYMFAIDRETGNVFPFKKKELSSWMKAYVWSKLERGDRFSDDFDPEIWVDNQVLGHRERSERIREEIKRSLPALDNYCESLAVEIKFLKDRLAGLEAKPSGEASGPWVKGSVTAHSKDDPRDQILGTWDWFNRCQVTIKAGGSFTVSTGQSGTWECIDLQKRRFRLTWERHERLGGPWYDDLTLAPDGKRLEGQNQVPIPVWGNKKQP